MSTFECAPGKSIYGTLYVSEEKNMRNAPFTTLSITVSGTKIIMKDRITIGRKDKADFPELGLNDLDIKMDTGAYTSAIHCHKITVKEKDGKNVLTFNLLDPSHPQYEGKEYATVNFREKVIRSSFGTSEKRFIIKTDILLFGNTYSIELSLSERGEMKFPILIGRKFLMGLFIVDPAKHDLSFKNKKKINKDK